ncbi:MAG TPA: hypothetical protein VHM48_12630 [Candidatus Limnocylindrales bacterium]|nr:hypothetical protein [Candidatus Limnocylindrales bacterium]
MTSTISPGDSRFTGPTAIALAATALVLESRAILAANIGGGAPIMASLVVRFRRATAEERRKVKLLTLAGVVLIALQGVLSQVIGGNTLAVAGSTLVVAALFQPMRRRVKGALDRRFDRARYDAQRTVDAFAEEVRNEVDLARLRTALLATAGDAVRPVSPAVWLRTGPADR